MAVQLIKIGSIRINVSEIRAVELDPAGGVWVHIGNRKDQVLGEDAVVLRAWAEGHTVKLANSPEAKAEPVTQVAHVSPVTVQAKPKTGTKT